MDNRLSSADMERYFIFALRDDDAYAVTFFNKELIEKDGVKSLVIPSSYNEKPVTVIGKGAFSGGIIGVEAFEGVVKDVNGEVVEREVLVNPKLKNNIRGKAYIDNVYAGPVINGNVYRFGLGQCIFETDSLGQRVQNVVCDTVKSVVIPDSVTEIEQAAFSGCSELTDLTIGNGVKAIGSCAFSACNALTEIVISNSVTYLGTGVFTACKSLESITLGDGITEINALTFSDIKKDKLKSLKIGKGLIKIGKDTFGRLPKYLQITVDCENKAFKAVDDTLYTKDGKTLLQCFNNRTIFTVPDGVTDIAVNAFIGRGNLTGLIIPASVKKLDHGIISFCDNCKTIFYKGTKAEWGNISIDESNDCDLKNTTIYFYSETPSGNSWRYASDGVTPEITHSSIFSKFLNKIKDLKK